MGEWDKVAIKYGYSDFPDGADEGKLLGQILDEAWARDIRYMTNQDTDANPRVDQWSNGTDPAAELTRMLAVRKASFSRFGENAIKRGQPLALMEEVLVPLYLHHRYQVDAAASALGGLHYIYAMRGDGREPVKWVPAREQQAALDALLAAIKPSELALPAAVLERLPPRPSGYGMHRELFPRNTGQAFDPIAPATVAADLVIANLLNPARAARLVSQHAVDPSLPGLGDVIDRIAAATFRAVAANPYEAEIARATQYVFVDNLIALADRAPMPQVRAIATQKLRQRMNAATNGSGMTSASSAMAGYVAAEIKRFLDRPLPATPRLAAPDAPPGAPIGEPAMNWLRRSEEVCGAYWY
jgi:hypothetical protein